MLGGRLSLPAAPAEGNKLSRLRYEVCVCVLPRIVYCESVCASVCLTVKPLSQTDVPLWDRFVRSVLEEACSSNKVIFMSMLGFFFIFLLFLMGFCPTALH